MRAHSSKKGDTQEAAETIAGINYVLRHYKKFIGVLERAQQPERPADFAAIAQSHNFTGNEIGLFIKGQEGQEHIVLNPNETNPNRRASVLREEKQHALNYAINRYIDPTFLERVHEHLKAQLSSEYEELNWVERRQGMTNQQWAKETADEAVAKFNALQAYQDDDSHLSVEETIKNTRHKRVARYFRCSRTSCIYKSKRNTAVKKLLPLLAPEMMNRVQPLLWNHQLAWKVVMEVEIVGTITTNPKAKVEMRVKDPKSSAKWLVSSIPSKRTSTKQRYSLTPIQIRTHQRNAQVMQDVEDEFNMLKDTYTSSMNPEEDEALAAEVADLNNYIAGEVMKKIAEFDNAMLDVRGGGDGITWKGFWDSVTFMNVFDFVKMFKDIGEDIKQSAHASSGGKGRKSG